MSLGPNPLWRGSLVSMKKEFWTFAVKREGEGSHGRPLSLIQIRIEGAEVTGALEDSDLLELPRTPIASEMNAYRKIRNLSESVNIVAQSIPEAEECKSYWFQPLMISLIGLLVVFGVVAYRIFSEVNK